MEFTSEHVFFIHILKTVQRNREVLGDFGGIKTETQGNKGEKKINNL